MDSQSLTVLIGAASLVVGVVACWLVMRGRIAAAAAQGKAKVEIELVKATERMQALDADRQATVANYEEMMKAQAGKAPLRADKIGALGFCFGGSTVLELARTSKLRALSIRR